MGGLYTGGAYTWTIFCASVIVINKNINSDKQVGLYSGGLILGWAYIWNEVSVSTCGRLIHRGIIFGGGLYSEVYGNCIYSNCQMVWSDTIKCLSRIWRHRQIFKSLSVKY
jgi:hypothetical protein